MENDDRKRTKAEMRNINALFRSPESYRIPQFQRPYAWKKSEQWEPLWEDVRKVAERYLEQDGEENVRPHFLGAIVLQLREARTGEVRKTLVVDGQQRLTTLQLLIKATQQVFQQMDYKQRAARLRELTENPDDQLGNDRDNKTKIRQSNLSDQKSFQEAIGGIVPADQGNQWPITQSYLYFKEEVEQWLRSGADDASARATALKKALTKYIQIAAIDLAEDEKPHVIFESLNARGESLTQSDLIKNTVMYEADVVDDAEKASELWVGMFDGDQWWRESTSESTTRLQLDRFLNHWMIMKSRKSIARDKVASEFRALLDKDPKPSIESVANDIKSSGMIYKDILENRDPYIKTLFLKRVMVIEMWAVMPLLIWLRKSDIPSNRLERCAQVLESYLGRRMLCGLGSHSLSTFFIRLLEKLHQEPSRRYDLTMTNHLSSTTSDSVVWPNDRMLLERIKERPLAGNVARRKMVLEAIELELRGDRAEPLGSTDELTIEHIMPQKWETRWPLPEEKRNQEDVDIRHERVKYLGNLTLTTGKLNASLSNAPWNEKQETLDKHSTLFLNKDLLSSAPPEWSEDTILERTDRLVRYIIKIWKPAEYFRETSDSLGDS